MENGKLKMGESSLAKENQNMVFATANSNSIPELTMLEYTLNLVLDEGSLVVTLPKYGLRNHPIGGFQNQEGKKKKALLFQKDWFLGWWVSKSTQKRKDSFFKIQMLSH